MCHYIYVFNHSFTYWLTRSNLKPQNSLIIDLFLPSFIHSLTHSVSQWVAEDNIQFFWPYERIPVYSVLHVYFSTLCVEHQDLMYILNLRFFSCAVNTNRFLGSMTSRENVCVGRDVSTPYRIPSSFLKFLSNRFRSSDTEIERDAVGSSRVCDKWWQKMFGLRVVSAVTGERNYRYHCRNQGA